MNAQVQMYLDDFRALFVEETGDNLVGIYLHGSSAMGCFNPSKSDIDLLVVIKEKMTVPSTKRLVIKLLSLRERMKNGLEFSVILETHLKEFLYPTPCELHYSDYHREKYQADDNYLCGGYTDKDLASQIAVAYHRGRVLYGQALAELYPPIPKDHYLSSILHDIASAREDILDNPMYITLNLCRVLFFIREGEISSKREGGEWGVLHLPNEYQDLIQCYLDEYNGLSMSGKKERNQLTEFADYMLETIFKQPQL